MNLGGLILGVPIFGAATFALWWVTRRMPKGGKGLASGFGAMLGIPVVALGAWLGALCVLTSATYVCIDCGRTEEQERFFSVPLTSEVVAEGEDYAKRFPGSVERGHAHRWHLDGCLRSWRRVCCTMQHTEGWFRVLPKLRDGAAADKLYHEARELPEDRRLSLMQEISEEVWIHSEVDGEFDRAFAEWEARRR